MAQLCLLVRGRIGWAAAVGLVVLQAVLVNLHSYFALGLLLTAAALADRVVRSLWRRAGREAEGPVQARRAAMRLALVLAAQVGVCLLNPWGWRLAALPFQTLAFMRRNAIAGADYDAVRHPWSVIGEFFRPFAAGVFEQSKASYAYLALLGLAGAGMVAAALRRRWSHLLIVAGMTAASLTMRRNIAPAALLIVPPALSAIRELIGAVAGRLGARPRPAWQMAAAGAITVAGLWGVFNVVTHRFYRDERRAVRFGLGVSRTVVPVGPAEWINAHEPRGRLWTDYNSSSNVLYFTRPHREVPILTNTWAYPPGVMQRVLDYSRGRRPFGSGDAPAAFRIVVLRMDRTSIPLGRALERDPKWALVYLDAMHVVFLSAEGPNAGPVGLQEDPAPDGPRRQLLAVPGRLHAGPPGVGHAGRRRDRRRAPPLPPRPLPPPDLEHEGHVPGPPRHAPDAARAPGAPRQGGLARGQELLPAGAEAPAGLRARPAEPPRGGPADRRAEAGHPLHLSLGADGIPRAELIDSPLPTCNPPAKPTMEGLARWKTPTET
jgi:hypothetical protein